MSRRHSLPPEVYALVEQTPATVLLESSCSPDHRQAANSKEAPWTQLFMAPFRICTAYEPAEVPALFAAIESAVAAGHTAAGFFSYECGACFEPKATMHSNPGTPLAWFGLYERAFLFNHDTGEFIGGAPPGLGGLSSSYGSGILHGCNERSRESIPNLPQASGRDFKFALAESDYSERIAAIHDWIRKGDVYQLNFTAPAQIRSEEGPAALYTKLRLRQPVEYGAFLHWAPGRHVLSFSPELFFRIDENAGIRRITARPMKGTAPRGRTTAEDQALAEWLRNDPKNRSENVMIVDLVRNDLGRLARFGTVRTEDMFAAERYPTLWQMTSTVTGELRPGVGFEDIFRALFPCGSITGAPKLRAMQLIAELEEQPRGIYTGAIGFFSPQKSVFNVAIRTIDLDGKRGTMGSGSGIVIDSNAADEYREVLLKADFLTGASRRPPAYSPHSEKFSLIETMLWDGTFPLIQLHLDRLTDSADYFGIHCDRGEMTSALKEYSERFEVGQAQRVRLLLGADGSLQITAAMLPLQGGKQSVGRVRIATEHTDPSDPLLFHKTTHRALYTQAFKGASAAGYDDALFLNLRGEVTEGAISNVFVEKDRRLLTPPIECGLLAGVFRRHLLATREDVEERVLHLDDLQIADAVYLANAVRGFRRVRIDWDEPIRTSEV